MATDSQGSQVHTVIAVSIIFAVLTFFVLSLRLYARYYVLRTIGLVDCKSSQIKSPVEITDETAQG